jgi:error-prone DNA polymerase
MRVATFDPVAEDVSRARRQSRAQRSPARPCDTGYSPLPEMDLAERLRADLVGTGVTVGPHPVALFRDLLRARGVRSAAELGGLPDGARVRVAGAVICRQRPGTAKGFLFLTLEDETGLVNVTVRPDLFERRHATLVGRDLLEIEGLLQNRAGTSVRALEVDGVGEGPCGGPALSYSRDFAC